MSKSKYDVKIILRDDYSNRNLKQRVNSHETVLLATFCRQFDILKQSLPITSHMSPFEIIIHSDSSNIHVFALQLMLHFLKYIYIVN